MKQQPAKILRWVKASERLPEKDSHICFKISEGYTNAYVVTRGNGHRAIVAYSNNEIKNWKIGEWLEETQDLSAPASPVEEKREEFEIWANEYSNRIMADTPRAFREHMGAEIHSALTAAHRRLTESRPSTFIDIEAARIIQSLVNNVQELFDAKKQKGSTSTMKDNWNFVAISLQDVKKLLQSWHKDFTPEPSASHPAPALIVGEREEENWRPIPTGNPGEMTYIKATPAEQALPEEEALKNIELKSQACVIDDLRAELAAAHSLIKDLQSIL